MAAPTGSGHGSVTPDMLGFAALQHSPSPIIILSWDPKKIVFCNYAMERLFHRVRVSTSKETDPFARHPPITSENIKGRTLSEMGVGLVQEGSAVFLDLGWTRLLAGLRPRPPSSTVGNSEKKTVDLEHRDSTETVKDLPWGPKFKDATADVVFSLPQTRPEVPSAEHDPSYSIESTTYSPSCSPSGNAQLEGKVIITPFEITKLPYFLLTFVNVGPVQSPFRKQPTVVISPNSTPTNTWIRRSTHHEDYSGLLDLNAAGNGGAYLGVKELNTTAMGISVEHSERVTQPTILQKLAIMKNAVINTIEVPVFATWIDGSCLFANKTGIYWAAVDLPPLAEAIAFMDEGWLAKFKAYDAEFKTELALEDFPLSRVCRTRKPLESQKVGLINKSGERKVFDCAGEGILDSNGEWIAGMIWLRDVTRVQAEFQDIFARQARENARLVAKELSAKEASRLKSQFLANMSHEIRTPIAGVLGMSEILLDTTLTDEQQEYAENIQRSANALLTVINDILDFSKVESGRLDIEEVQFSLSLVLSDIIRMMGIHAEKKRLHFITNIEGAIHDDLQVLGDPGRVRQIITNLLSNSIKFTTEGYVRLTAVVEEEMLLDVDTDSLVPKLARGAEKYMIVRFDVEDTGIGIKDDVIKNLFKPFGQADSSTARKFGGTGLGLAISKNLVDLMGGFIELTSVYGKGTKATVKVPFRFPLSRSPRSIPSETLLDLDSVPERLQNDASLSIRSRSDASASPRFDPASNIGVAPISPLYQESGQPETGIETSPRKEHLAHARSKSRSHSSTTSNHIPLHAHPQTDPKYILPMERRQRMHILVVEDNKINQQIALKLIKKLGFNVSAVSNGQEAIDYLIEANVQFPKDVAAKIPREKSSAKYAASINRQVQKMEEAFLSEPDYDPSEQRPANNDGAAISGKVLMPDLILMDCHMPVLDGYSATRAVRLLPDPLRHLPVIAMTASAIKGDREKCRDAGMSDYLSKPVVTSNLERMLVKWLSYANDDNYQSLRMDGRTPPRDNMVLSRMLKLTEVEKHETYKE